MTVAVASAEHPRNSEGAVFQRSDGSLLLIYQEYVASERGGGDDAPNRLVAVVSNDGGHSWAGKRVVAEPAPHQINVYSPSLLPSQRGELLLFYYAYQTIGSGQEVDSTGYILRSTDEGEHFGDRTAIWEHRPFGCASSAVKRLPSGRLLFPVEHHIGELWTPQASIQARCLIGEDDGETWQEGDAARLPLRGCMEPHVEALTDGSVLMVMRTQLGSVFSCRSRDGGLTWSAPQATALRAPESCPELARHPRSGDLWLLWNDSEYDPAFGSHFGKRSPLSLAVSGDEGRTWQRRSVIESDPNRAFTNPGVCFLQDGSAIVNYWTCRYRPDRRMAVDRIDLRLALLDGAGAPLALP